MTAPCKDCPDRVVGCHSICKDYKAFREEKDREAELRNIQAKGMPIMSRQRFINWKIKQKERERTNRG